MRSGSLNRSISEGLGFAAATVFAPVFLIRSLSKASLRRTLAERFGAGGWGEFLNSLDVLGEKPWVWFHAASVGEFGAIVPVLEKFRNSNPELQILVTTTSETGRDASRASGLADMSLILPYDHPWLFQQLFKRLLGKRSPELVIITETELWPNFLLALKEKQIPVVLINARISDYTFPNYRRWAYLLRPVVEVFDKIFCQGEHDLERFAALGVARDRITVCGSTKYDREIKRLTAEDQNKFAASLGLFAERPCFVAGSVRPGEDRAVISAFLEARQKFPNLQLVIAPRHPECFEDTARLLEKSSLTFNKRSDGPALEQRSVLLLDTVGELKDTYGLANFAFVGGSLVDIGGHNPLEPAAYGIPVIVGPHTSTVRDAVSMLKKVGGLFEVRGEEELSAVVQRLLEDPTFCSQAGSAAKSVWEMNVGASERVFQGLAEIFDSNVPGGFA